MGKRKFHDGGNGGKKRPFLGRKARDDDGDNEQSNAERHPGSYPLEELKSHPQYQAAVSTTSSNNVLKRKFALCISYLGTAYQGLQINPGAKTVEAEVEKSLFLAGAIIEENYGFMHKVNWTRCARTDRGVHAMTQCLSMKLLVPSDQSRDQFLDRVNNLLPNDITIQSMTKVSKGFNAKNDCTKRRYHYLLPTYCLMNFEEMNSQLQQQYQRQVSDHKDNPQALSGIAHEGGYIDRQCTLCAGKQYLESVRSQEQLSSFRLDAAALARLKAALQLFEGTRSYHNFTTGKDGNDASASRYILSFSSSEPFTIGAGGDQTEYVLLEVLGQSFLLNQIRKMVGSVIDVVRGKASVEQIQSAFQKDNKIEVPMAPAAGLYLDELFFDFYNTRQQREVDRKKVAIDNKTKKAAEDTAGSSEGADNAEAAVDSNIVDEAEAEEEKDQPEEKDQDASAAASGELFESLNWYAEASTKAKLDEFRSNKLHPHIYEQERRDLPFMFYLDYYRAFPLTYVPSTWAKKA